MKNNKDFKRYLANLFRAKFPIIYIETWEENRVIELVKNLSKDTDVIKTHRNIYVWSSTTGLVNMDTMESVDKLCNAVEAINTFNDLKENGILILKDIHASLSNLSLANNNNLKRILKQVIVDNKDVQKQNRINMLNELEITHFNSAEKIIDFLNKDLEVDL